MFGKKRKQAQLEAERARQLALEKEQEEKQHPAVEQQPEQEKIFLESEIIDDDDAAQEGELEAVAYDQKQDAGDALVAESVDETAEQEHEQPIEDVVKEVTDAQEPAQSEPKQETVEEPAEEPVQEATEEVVEDTQELAEEPEQDAQEPATAPSAEQQEEVVYVVDGPEEDDEIVKPAKLVKLPNLVDYMLSLNMSKQMKMNVAMLLLSAYNKFKEIPEERKIIVNCMKKIMQSLIQGWDISNLKMLWKAASRLFGMRLFAWK